MDKKAPLSLLSRGFFHVFYKLSNRVVLVPSGYDLIKRVSERLFDGVVRQRRAIPDVVVVGASLAGFDPRPGAANQHFTVHAR
jgi:hypothetical protein